MNRSKSMDGIDLFDLSDPASCLKSKSISPESQEALLKGATSQHPQKQNRDSRALQEADNDFICENIGQDETANSTVNCCSESSVTPDLRERSEGLQESAEASDDLAHNESDTFNSNLEKRRLISALNPGLSNNFTDGVCALVAPDCETDSFSGDNTSSQEQSVKEEFDPNIEIDEEIFYYDENSGLTTSFSGDIVSTLVSELVEATVTDKLSHQEPAEETFPFFETTAEHDTNLAKAGTSQRRPAVESDSEITIETADAIVDNSFDFIEHGESSAVPLDGVSAEEQNNEHQQEVVPPERIDDCDIPEEPSPLPSELNFGGNTLSASVPADLNISSFEAEERQRVYSTTPSASFDFDAMLGESSSYSVEVGRSCYENARRSPDVLDRTVTGLATPSPNDLESSQVFQLMSRTDPSPSVLATNDKSVPFPMVAEQSIILSLGSEMGEAWRPFPVNEVYANNVNGPAYLTVKKEEGDAIKRKKLMSDALLPPCHRRFFSDNTEASSSSPYKKLLEEHVKREQEECNENSAVFLRADSRKTSVGNRSKSQLILRDSSTSDELNADQSDIDSHKNLSTSTPSVHEGSFSSLSPEQAEHEVIAEILNIGENRDVQSFGISRKETNKWSQLMPSAFGAHQVISPMQRSARLIPTSGVALETSPRPHVKSKVEKKTRKSSGFLDFFPSVRKKPQNTQRIFVRTGAGGASALIDRRSTMLDGTTTARTLSELPHELASAINDRPQTIGVTEGRLLAASIKEELEFMPQINKPKWADLDLWTDEFASWSSQNVQAKLSKQERKRQDVIYELYITEKHYCQVLVILQQVYQEGLRVRGVLKDEKRNELIPTVLDALLDFHLGLLRKLQTRRKESMVVSGVSDIICSEFESGEKHRAAVYAYTEICSKKDLCGQLYDIYRGKNLEFRKFFDEFEKNPLFKDRTFKMCLLLIAQRLTKYPVLFDQLHKLEASAGKEQSLKALQAVKRFAEHVDTELNKIEMNRRWDWLRSRLSHSSVGRHNQNISFTYNDLVLLPEGSDQRKVLRIGDATCYGNTSSLKSEDGVAIKLALFDDILVILTKAQGKNGFIFHDRGPAGCSVVKVKTLIVRDVPRKSLMLFLIANNPPASDLIPIEFPSKTEFAEWKKILQEAALSAPSYVRRAVVTAGETSEQQEDPEEVVFNLEMDRWDVLLCEFFEKRKNEENDLSIFIEKRLQWFDELHALLLRVPNRTRSDGQRPVLSDKIKSTVKKKFDELRTIRWSSLSKVMERAQRASEEELLSYFDDVHDANIWTLDTSPSSDQSENDESRAKLPKRNSTFNGTPDRQKDSSIRRHTTEPKLAERRLSERETESTAETSGLRKLTLELCPPARRSLARIVDESVKVRIENSKLRDDIAMMSLQMAAQKQRRTAAATVGTLEALRNKQNKLQEEQRSFQSYRETLTDDLKRRESEILDKERYLKISEEQLEEKWKTFFEASNSENKHRPLGPTRPVLPTNSFRSVSSMHDRANLTPPRQLQPSPINKSASSSSMPMHLAEKTSKVTRIKK